ncbi:MAG: DUF4276 family protein [Bacteroidales bacterium]|nr:DUF4276 family protein [Bacteroidales bacterium]
MAQRIQHERAVGEKYFRREALSSFIRLHITAEGQTEERFVKDVLVHHLGNYNTSTDVRRVKTSKDKYKTYRGGLINYSKAKFDIKNWLVEDTAHDVRFSTMFDLYALPRDFPGYEEAKNIKDCYAKVEMLEKRLKEDISDDRFIPYIQLHEFESLVFANPDNIKEVYFNREGAIQTLKQILEHFGNNPEKINDSEQKAPSKRILHFIPEYDKVTGGPIIAAINNIDFLKRKCPHFGEWLHRLENL